MTNPLFIGAEEREKLDALRRLAAEKPVFMPDLMERLKDPEGKRQHMAQMTAQTIHIPFQYFVTFSIETGHPIGTCRHMSMSSGRKGRVPSTEAVWAVCEELGYQGQLSDCSVWLEDLKGREKAVNVVQPIAMTEAVIDRPQTANPDAPSSS